MSLADLSAIGTLLSSVAVLVSLIYLGLQMRQNTKHTRALIHQGRIERIIDFQLRSTEPTLAAAIIVGNGGQPTREAVLRHQFERSCWAACMSMEETFAQRAEGLIGDVQFDGLKRGITGMMSEPGMRRFWQTFRLQSPGSRFGAFVDEIVAGMPEPGPPLP